MARSGDDVFTRLGRKVGALLEEGVPGAPARPAPEGLASSSAGVPEAAGPISSTDLLGRLQRVAGEGAELVAGRVNFLDLDKLKEAVGPRWDQMSERVGEVVRRAIERRLTPADMYTQFAGHRYLILFSRLSPEEAQLKCALIGEEISKRLLGESLPKEAVRVQTAVSRVDGTVGLEAVPGVDQMAEALYARVGVAVPASPVGPEPTISRSSASDDPMQAVRLMYRPMWDVKRNVVSTYIYVPAAALRGGGVSIGEGVISRIEEPGVAFDLDLMIVQKLIDDLAELQETGRQLLLAAPVHFETMATSGRRAAYMRVCQIIPPAQRRYVIFELVDVPSGIPQSRLLEIATMLKRNARSLMLRTSLTDPRLRSLGETGVPVVGVNLAELRLPERQVMKAMDRFCELAQKSGLRTYVHGLRTLSLTTAAVGAGFDYIDGDVVTSVVEAPGGLYHFDTRSLFKSPGRRDRAR